ncbi:MAG: endonuclease NucS [Gammaproteobacteria bacterium]|nr:endonuclease NucS [Gammaproteobacteria bacterium]
MNKYLETNNPAFFNYINKNEVELSRHERLIEGVTTMTERYWKVMLGESDKLIKQASQCFKEGYIGIDFPPKAELTKANVDKMAKKSGARKRADEACINLFSEMSIKDIVICPDGYGNYAVGKITSGYKFAGKKEPLFHRRKVDWCPEGGDICKGIPKSKMCPELSRILSARSGTIRDISDQLTVNGGRAQIKIDELRSDKQTARTKIQLAELNASDIAPRERMLGDYFLAKRESGNDYHNWKDSQLGKDYNLFEKEHADDYGHEMLKVFESSKPLAREYQTPVGNIDILAVKKKGQGREYLVIELKRTYSSDAVGQVIRYMGYLKSATNDGTKIRGCIIGHGEDDHTLSALEAVNAFAGSGSIDIDFYCYEIEEFSEDRKEITTLNLRKVDIPRKFTPAKE